MYKFNIKASQEKTSHIKVFQEKVPYLDLPKEN